MPDIPISPEVLARARAVALDPGSVDCHPALLATAWDILKAARGQTVDHSRLTPLYLIGTGATQPAPEADILTQTYERTVATIRSIVARRHYPGAGGAA